LLTQLIMPEHFANHSYRPHHEQRLGAVSASLD
jgi:hypothetical protein